ncbi:ubiquinone biosynthesis protein [Anaerosolibacter carboniphilus]|uniref:Ubiquinone biosynthesis protein n=1 Tax=Anaerosolibacter carboniphilus TaxID=1417629 RepID=A0A841KRR2_9FIRM|nr:AarF/UbiB family protein [Anaerosolibacter carboniphilus]MBB6214838.1 ubiquinone biosynthesis protein [Anaerosolibacter carboniphilus]
MTLRKIGNGYKNIRRYKEIGEILIKYGFDYIAIKLFPKGPIQSWIQKKSNMESFLPVEKRIRMALEELGPTFIKLGQILSTRPDLLSEEMINELSMLQDCAPAFPIHTVEKIFLEETGVKIQNAFLEFQENPVAAASIGQVHQARLRNGTKVVVKIQRPNIKQIIQRDMSILCHLATLFDEYFKDEMPVHAKEIVEEYSHSIIRELDYSLEARNTERFRENFKNQTEVCVPLIFWEYTTKRILVLEEIEGIKAIDVIQIRQRGWDTAKIGDIIARSFMKQVFLYGLFHGDPHPGNIFVLAHNKVAFIDMGITSYLDKKTMAFITNLFIAGAKKNVDKIINLLIEIEAVSQETEMRRLKEDISFVLNYYYNTPLKNLKMSEAVSELMRIAYDNRIKLPSQFTILGKAIITLEGCVKRLNPDFSLSDVTSQFMKEITTHKLNPKRLANELLDYSEDVFFTLKDLPLLLKSLMKRIDKNEMRFTIEQPAMQSISRELDRFGVRISVSIMISSILIASAMGLKHGDLEKMSYIGRIAAIGYIISGLLGIVFIILIIYKNSRRSRRK